MSATCARSGCRKHRAMASLWCVLHSTRLDLFGGRK